MSDQPRCENEETLRIVEHALQNLWGVANDLSLIRPPADRYRVTIFGSARAEPGDETYGEVVQLAKRLTELGCDIVTGGGPGLMAAANEGAHLGDPGDEHDSVGIRVDLPFEQGANPFVEKLYTHRTFFSRLHQFLRVSNAFVVVEGGIGTTLETLMVWQLLQVRHVDDVPLILVGEMWRELRDWASRNMAERERPLAGAEDVALPLCVETIAEAEAAITAHREAWQAARDAARPC
jgi:predicted Rossmann-fold nucleotide-binding protein